MAAKKKAQKKAATESAFEKDDPRDPKPRPAIVPEQTVTRRGTAIGGTRTMTKSEYDNEMKNG